MTTMISDSNESVTVNHRGEGNEGIKLNVWVSDDLPANEVVTSLQLMDQSVAWQIVDLRQDAQLHLSSPESASGDDIPLRDPALAGDAVVAKMMDRRNPLILPTQMGKQILRGLLEKEEEAFFKVKKNNAASLAPGARAPESSVSDKFGVAAWPVHPTILKSQVPGLKRKLDVRVVNQLQRTVPNYVALVALDETPQSRYPELVTTAQEHLNRVQEVKHHLEELGIDVPNTDMSKNQLNLGVFFPGGRNRDVQGMIPPTPLFKECAKHVADVMLLGHAYAYNHDPDAFRETSVRIGVKVDNFQGAPFATSAHSIRLTYWAMAIDHPQGLFMFHQYDFPTIAGFRRQGNGKGKKRASFVLDAPGSLVRSHVLDSDDLAGKTIVKYGKSITDIDTIVDDGWYGARDRIVGNVWSAQNDLTLGVPATIAAFKNAHYKMIFQQDDEILGRFITGTSEFEEFWREGYEDNAWVRDLAAKRGCDTFDSLMHMMDMHGEHIVCGDVENFDGNATWEVTSEPFKHIMSDNCLAMTDKMWNADKLGVYCGADGSAVYYYIACQPDSRLDDNFNNAAKRTAKAMSHVPSGIGPTAQAGRGVVPAALMELVIDNFPEMKEYLFKLPPFEGSKFSALSALMNSAGDDHSMGSLIIWLVTGIHPRDAMQKLLDNLENYKVMKIAPEFPKMNAGYLFHEDDDGRLTHITLSPGRCFSNTVFPERPRSATGLLASLQKYRDSAIDSPIEKEMSNLVDIIITEIFGFDDIGHLIDCAQEDEVWLANNSNELPAVERLALLLDIPMNDLEWKYTIDELLEMGAPMSLLNEFRRPIPSELTKDPFQFLSETTITQLANKLQKGNI